MYGFVAMWNSLCNCAWAKTVVTRVVVRPFQAVSSQLCNGKKTPMRSREAWKAYINPPAPHILTVIVIFCKLTSIAAAVTENTR